jgi:hypothetical protein
VKEFLQDLLNNYPILRYYGKNVLHQRQSS